MSMNGSEWGSLVAIGEVARAQGRQGEVIINPLTDFPERFQDLERVFVEGTDGEPVALRLEWVRKQRGRPVLKFREINGIGEAERLSGCEIRIPESELVSLPEGSLFHFELEGCEVWDRVHGFVGVVKEIMVTGGTDLLVVRDGSGHERLIPICKEICRRLETSRRQIEIHSPEGLLTLDAD